ncbi:hypothetical protein [Nocardiopsis ganjiahuensis]|uniref:hypothetical protein n=1 Tax=Nocardiopsis ganjiahuensis TaxID=239984 RepID=UPI000348E1C7|nr:hypothetical protein [Nocardiopsis ganjiahuensis]
MTADPPFRCRLSDAVPLRRALPGLYARAVRQSCAGLFAVVWADAEPLGPGRSGIEIVDEVSRRVDGERFPAEYPAALGEGLSSAWTDGDGPGPGHSARIRITDALWHPVDSGPRSFRLLGELLAAEIAACVLEGRAPRPRLLPGNRTPFSWERDLLPPGRGDAP